MSKLLWLGHLLKGIQPISLYTELWFPQHLQSSIHPTRFSISTMVVFTVGFYVIDYVWIKGGRRSSKHNTIALIEPNQNSPTLKFWFFGTTLINITQFVQTQRICEIFLKKLKIPSKLLVRDITISLFQLSNSK